jgi:hypothetical protein
LKTDEGDHRMACPITFYSVVKRDNVFNHFTIEVCQDLLATERAIGQASGLLLKAFNAIGIHTEPGHVNDYQPGPMISERQNR